MKNSLKLVVFSDLDGTLLDHRTYSWAPAKPALARLKRLGVPVVLSSSKTAAEITVLQADMGLSHYPAIVENGAGVIGLPTQDGVASDDYENLRRALDTLPDTLRGRFVGFGDMTVQDVVQVTGLALPDAERAKMRNFSEPGLWLGDAETLTIFKDTLQAKGVRAQQGGRFLTLSFGASKAAAMKTVTDVLDADMVLALGDAPNDIEMLDKADVGVIIANPASKPLPKLAGETAGRVTRSDKSGPQGWNESVNALLDDLMNTTGILTHG